MWENVLGARVTPLSSVPPSFAGKGVRGLVRRTRGREGEPLYSNVEPTGFRTSLGRGDPAPVVKIEKMPALRAC